MAPALPMPSCAVAEVSKTVYTRPEAPELKTEESYVLSPGDAIGKIRPIIYKGQERKLCAHPYVEIYKGDKIIFMCPLSRQDDFYVPEMKELLRKEKGDEALPEAEGPELDPLLLEDTLTLELVSESPEEAESESTQRKEKTDSEKSPSESGNSASSFEELDLDGNVLGGKSQLDCKTTFSKMPDTWEKERPEE